MKNSNALVIGGLGLLGLALLSRKPAASTGAAGDSSQTNIGLTIPETPAPDFSFLAGLMGGNTSNANPVTQQNDDTEPPIDTSLGGIFSRAKKGIEAATTDIIAPPGGILDTMSAYRSPGGRFMDFWSSSQMIFSAGGMTEINNPQELAAFRDNLTDEDYVSQKPTLIITPDGKLDPIAQAGMSKPPWMR